MIRTVFVDYTRAAIRISGPAFDRDGAQRQNCF